MSNKKSKGRAALEETTQTQRGRIQGQRRPKVRPEKEKQSGEKIAEDNIRNITERKEIEAGLEKTRKELEATKIFEDAAREYAESIINTVRESLIVLDQDLRVVSVSRSFYEFFKVKPEETVGQLIYDLGNKQWDIPKLRELLETILPQKTSFENYEVEHDFATIGKRIMLLNARQIQRVLGKERIILLAIEDITEKKDLEGVVRARDAAEAANKELEAFSYSISHDLRAPLRAMSGFSKILSEEYQSQMPPEAGRYLGLIGQNAQQMGLLIDDLLRFSNLSRQALNMQMVSPADLARQVWEDLAQEREGRQVEFILGRLPACQADPALLKQVFVNLLSNALKFTRKRDPAQVEVGWQIADSKWQIADSPSRMADVELPSAISHQPSAICYFVRDNGVGFDMRYADKLFGVFQRLHRAEEYEGTGVGLAIVQRIVHRHGGEVWAEGKVGEGAVFYFTMASAQTPPGQNRRPG
jgi:PAS domain S-box-containing protein